MNNESRFPWRAAAFYACAYAANSLYQNYISIYLDHNGFSKVIIGAVLSAAPLVSIIAQPIWGMVGDRISVKNNLLRVLYFMGGFIVAFYGASTALWVIIPLVCAFSFFQIPILPLADAITLEYLGGVKKPFGPVRMTGTIAFAVVSPLTGVLLTKDALHIFPYAASAVFIAAGFSTFFLPKVPGHQREGRHASMLALLKDKKLVSLLAFVTLLQMTLGYFYAFYGVYFTSELGGTNTLLGWGYFISAVSEIPFLLMADKLYNRLGTGKLLAIAAAVMAVRWTLLGVITSPYIAMVTQVFHGWAFIVITFTMAKHISLTVPDELKASGQMLLGVIGFGISRVIGSMLGGVLSDRFSMASVFVGCGAVALCAFLTFGIYYIRKPAGEVTGNG